MTDAPRRNSAPPYTILGITWECFVVDGAYQWRSTCGRLRAWSTAVPDLDTDRLGNRKHGLLYRASVDGRLLENKDRSLRGAMIDAAMHDRRTAARSAA